MKINFKHMKKSYNHDQLEEVFQVLKNPQKYWLGFFQKYKSNQQMLDLYEELRQYKEAGQKLEQIDAPNIGLEWQKMNYKHNKQKQRAWLMVASVAILLACTFVFQYKNIVGNQERYAAQVPVVEKGNSKAMLITSEGTKYILEKGVQRVIHEKSGVNIQADSNNVVQYGSAIGGDTKTSLDNLFNTLKVPRLGEYQLVLSDGTKVWMNSESELKYPLTFSGKERVVELIGEAYFDVEPNPEKPFIVKTAEINTRVLGTEFNVSAYPNEDVNITLVEGKVKLNSLRSDDIVLKPGENANWIKGESRISVEKVDVQKYIAWKDGYFYFEKERLEDILLKLERWYDFKVFYQNERVKDYLFRMRADREFDFSEIVDRLEQTGRISIKMNGNVITISDVNR